MKREEWDRRFFRRSLREAEQDPDCHLYRFSWVPELGNDSGAITLALSLPEPQAVVFRAAQPLRKTALTEQQIVSFLILLDRLDFWRIPEEEPEIPGILRVVMDGERWSIEGVRGGQYHHIQRHSPTNDADNADAAPVHALAEVFLDLGSVFDVRFR